MDEQRGEALLTIEGLSITFRTPGGEVTPVPEVSLQVHAGCLLYTSPSPRDGKLSRMPSSA